MYVDNKQIHTIFDYLWKFPVTFFILQPILKLLMAIERGKPVISNVLLGEQAAVAHKKLEKEQF